MLFYAAGWRQSPLFFKLLLHFPLCRRLFRPDPGSGKYHDQDDDDHKYHDGREGVYDGIYALCHIVDDDRNVLDPISRDEIGYNEIVK